MVVIKAYAVLMYVLSHVACRSKEMSDRRQKNGAIALGIAPFLVVEIYIAGGERKVNQTAHLIAICQHQN